MRYEIFVAHRRSHYTYEFDDYATAHRTFFKFYRKVMQYYPDSTSIWLNTAGYDEIEGVGLMRYTPEEGFVVNFDANERHVF